MRAAPDPGPGMIEPTPRLCIRPATPDDSHAIARLHFVSHTQSFRKFAAADWVASRRVEAYEADWDERLRAGDPDARTWVATEGGRIVGVMSVVPRAGTRPAGGGRIATLRAAHVDPQRLGRRIGTRLHETVLAFLRAHGFARALTDVIEANQRARGFFEAAGYRLVARAAVGGEGVPVVTCELDLSAPSLARGGR